MLYSVVDTCIYSYTKYFEIFFIALACISMNVLLTKSVPLVYQGSLEE